MKTTQMYIEQIILGMLVLIAIGLCVMPIFFVDRLVILDWFSKNSYGFAEATLVVMAAYLAGMVYDRVADTILEEVDRHHRLRFALKDTARETGKDGKVPKIKEDPFPETKLRINAMGSREATEDMDYLRSRIRLMRGLCTLIPLYTVIASLYVVTDWALPGSYQPLWVASSVAMLMAYGLVLLCDVISRPGDWQAPPKTGDLPEVNNYAKSHIVPVAGEEGKKKGKKDGKAIPVWLAADFYRDPAWYGFFFVIATSIAILAMNDKLATYWPVPVAGILLTLLTGWVWLRVSKTFMLFIASFAKYANGARR